MSEPSDTVLSKGWSDAVEAQRQRIARERDWLARGLCPANGRPIMPNGILRPACAICDCGEDEP